VNLSPIHQPLDCGESVTTHKATLFECTSKIVIPQSPPPPHLHQMGSSGWCVRQQCVARLSPGTCHATCVLRCRAHASISSLNISTRRSPTNRIVDLVLRLQCIDRLSLCNQPFVVGPLPWTLRRYAAMRAMEATQSRTMVPPQAPPPPPVAPFRFAMIYSDSMVLQRSSECCPLPLLCCTTGAHVYPIIAVAITVVICATTVTLTYCRPFAAHRVWCRNFKPPPHPPPHAFQLHH
jgi:hypothetical protein